MQAYDNNPDRKNMYRKQKKICTERLMPMIQKNSRKLKKGLYQQSRKFKEALAQSWYFIYQLLNTLFETYL